MNKNVNFILPQTATTTYTGLTAEQRVFYELKMLARAVPSFPHISLAQMGVHDPINLP